MSDFNIAIQTVIENEGTSFTNDDVDMGGATKFGLTIGFLQHTVDKNYTVEELKDLDLAGAESIYKQYWWDKYYLYTINNQDLATKVFDTFVNLGPNHATRIVQKSINDCGTPFHIDGQLGPITIAAINSANQVLLLQLIRSNLVTFYNDIVAKNPSQSKFIKGWLKRANG